MPLVRSESVRRVPSAPLRPVAGWYSGYRQAGIAPATHRGLPSPHLTFIVTLDDPLVIARHPDPAQAPGRYDALIGGLHTAPALVVHNGCQSGVQIALHPFAALLLLGSPAGELANLDVPATAVLGRAAEELAERLREARGWGEVWAVLDDWLASRMARQGRLRPPEGAARAWELIVTGGGRLSVEAIAAEVGWSARQLRAQLQRWTGLSPKAASRVVRFDRARRALAARAAASQPLELAGLAAACGYFDQAHLDREFCSLAGCPPSAWVVEERRNIQAGAHHGCQA